MGKTKNITVKTTGLIPFFDNAMPENFDNMQQGNIEILIIRALFKDNVIHKNKMSNLPVTLKQIFIKQIFNCDLESSYGYRHEVSKWSKFKENLEEIGIKIPFGCKVYKYKEIKYNDDEIIFSGCHYLDM